MNRHNSQSQIALISLSLFGQPSIQKAKLTSTAPSDWLREVTAQQRAAVARPYSIDVARAIVATEEAKREADWAQEQSGRIESELAAERKAREELEEQVSQAKDEVGKAEASERAAREALDAATAKRADLECQASFAHSDLEGARAAARQAQQRLTASKQLAERLHEAGQCISAELKRRAEVWENALADGNFDGLEDALASGGPTFAQITCQVESPSAKSQHEGRSDAQANEPEKRTDADADAAAVAQEVDSGDRKAAAADDDQRPAPHTSPSPALLPAASTSVLAGTAAEKPQTSDGAGGVVVEEVVDDEDELLAAAAGGPAGVAASADGTSAGVLPGCSTAWSLEVLDAAPSGDLLPPAKRLRSRDPEARA